MRAKFIDEVVLDEASDRLDELVLLGSGLDTRPYRLADQLRGVRVIEVDHPDSLESKRARLRRLLGREPDQVTFLAIDFVWAEAIDDSREYFGAAELRKNTAELEEPLRWGVPEGRVEETHSGCGLQVERVVDDVAGRSAYLRRSDGSLHDQPYGLGVLIHGRVA